MAQGELAGPERGTGESDLILRASRGAAEFPTLVAIWRSAIEATHHFLSAEDRDQIEIALPATYLPAVRLTVAELSGRPVGFAGTSGQRLEMLFVDDTVRGHGVGSALLDHVVREQGVTELDVNEQNSAALAFYIRRGFAITGRNECDDAGRPYPLLRLRRTNRP